ncbi:hypothetical protein RD792_011181 [Penstemon davidsonii]|uniref:SHSP domain-containing protein n=1 Tax=Penstemon davidsonii TaxID=160366 RepID=A0ABR0D4Q2_9LAMI|nr:hypothetical protein RD792_011181 [Penstemon davidsonii]
MSSIGPWHGGGRRGGGEGWDFGSPFSSDLWNPWDFGGGGGMIRGGRGRGDDTGDDVTALAHAHVDWRETDKAHIFRVDLPGVTKENLKVQVEDNNILQISGERVVEKEDDNDKWHRVERRRGSFSRRFQLPENVNVDAIKCGLEHGVLTVDVPKKEVQEEEKKNVRYIDIA